VLIKVQYLRLFHIDLNWVSCKLCCFGFALFMTFSEQRVVVFS